VPWAGCSFGNYFAGRIDDFRIINRSLAPEEIRALAETPKAAN